MLNRFLPVFAGLGAMFLGAMMTTMPASADGLKDEMATDATSNGLLRQAYDNNGLKDSPIRTQ